MTKMSADAAQGFTDAVAIWTAVATMRAGAFTHPDGPNAGADAEEAVLRTALNEMTADRKRAERFSMAATALANILCDVVARCEKKTGEELLHGFLSEYGTFAALREVDDQ